MALTLAEKIIQEHIVPEACPNIDFRKGNPIPRGEDIALKIDQTLTQDATGTMAYLQFETIGIPRVKTELSVSYIDHNTLQTDFKNMDDHRYLQSVAAKYGLYFSRPGNGICHQVHLECFGKPGKTLLGSDSHTPTGGGIGMIAIGAGGLDVAVAMGGGAFHTPMPKIFGVKLTGKLRKGVGAKDIILEVLRRETVKGGTGAIYEYFGDGAASLTVPQRATITNMGAELGATCSIFPSDEKTKKFLESMGRGGDWTRQEADEGAQYDKLIEIDLGSLHALAACPHNPDVIDSVKNLAGKKVTQVVIGSCTNSSLDDLESVAAIVKGKHIAPGVEAGIAPGSRTTLLMASKAGILGDLIEAGFRILESACGPCIGQGFAPNSEGVTLRTFNRNFKGRSGTADANVYLVSPETAAAAAVTGVFTEAETMEYDDPAYATGFRVSMLDGEDARLSSADVLKAAQDRGMVIAPLDADKAKDVEILRGPNIKPCPPCREYKPSLSLPVRLKAADNVSTDDIMPAGAKVLPLRSNIPEISKFTLTRLDETFYKRSEEASFADCCVVGGENYGQGSSREHAALGPMYLGVRAVITKSFARIHKANLINYGIIPMTFKNPADYDKIAQGDTLELVDIDSSLKNGTPFRVVINGKTEIECVNDIAARSASILMAGGLAAYTRKGGN
ncbi:MULTISPECIES: aconitate hydratase [Treponema]|uniref:Aconitate hydratase A n=1 Tax=Treponema saccharophilum DSM 2985 TaxID=907348 RepID=H7EP22_9SPIR|nr:MULTISPECIES: aconitate hydratase [Treponema]EIC00655.1 aconitase [Treponema saccharophilum DSM 2985]MBQ5538239.1 aconitate hydratase [Treponema sp.]BDC95744.1 aconitate hydratase [Treponema saccharophilum]